MEELIRKYMEKYSCSRDDAIQLIKDDDAIDKGAKLFELTKEQKAAAKKATITGTRKSTNNSKKERKVDETKKLILNAFRIYLEGKGAAVAPLTTEAEMHFSLDGENYTVKLVKHRPKKGER